MQPRQLHFAYYSLANGFDSTLLLVSDFPKPLDFVIAVRSRSGQTALTPMMTIETYGKLSIDLRKLALDLSADVTGDFAEGSVTIYFNGTIMPMAGQLTITDPLRNLSLESQMVDNPPGLGLLPKELHGLWWGIGAGRDAAIAVTNTSPEAVTADVFLDFRGKRQPCEPVSLGPHETRVLSVTNLLGQFKTSPAQAPEGGISIVPRSTKPALIAQGKITDPVTGFSSSLNFPLPELQRASALHASGVPIGVPSHDSPFAGLGLFIPHVIVRNLGAVPQTVTITIEYPGQDGPAQEVLPPIGLEGYSTRDVSLDSAFGRLPLPLSFCSIRIQYSGLPGSVIGEVSSIDVKGDLVIDNRLANEGDGWAGSGNHPWHLDAETESVLFLTNMGEQEVPVLFRMHAGGVTFFLTDLRLGPRETRAIDLRNLRDEQKPDFLGNVIPANATDGSVSWIRADLVPVMGRLVVLRRNKGIASNYDCPGCICPASFTGTLEVRNPNGNTNDYAMLVNNPKNFEAYAFMTQCNTSQFWARVTTDSRTNWKSYHPSIATVTNDSTSKGRVTGIIYGDAQIEAKHTGKVFPLPNCTPPQDRTGADTLWVKVSEVCNGERGTIVQEYIDYQVLLAIRCSFFTQTAHSQYFSFAELETGDYTWALVRRPLVRPASSGYGLDRWRELYGAPRIINSAYRNPARNAGIPGSAPQSRHMYGDAVDLRNESGTLTEWQRIYDMAGPGFANADYREPLSASGLGHVHADWRNHDAYNDFAQ